MDMRGEVDEIAATTLRSAAALRLGVCANLESRDVTCDQRG